MSCQQIRGLIIFPNVRQLAEVNGAEAELVEYLSAQVNLFEIPSIQKLIFCETLIFLFQEHFQVIASQEIETPL